VPEIHSFQSIPVKGILFLHGIDDRRTIDSTLRTMNQFSSLCTNDLRYAVVVVTTLWDTVQERDAVSRERQLKAGRNFLGMFTAANVAFRRHPDPPSKRTESAREAIRRLFDPRNVPKRPGLFSRILALFQKRR
jgi:hypothetical protein